MEYLFELLVICVVFYFGSNLVFTLVQFVYEMVAALFGWTKDQYELVRYVISGSSEE